MSSLSLLHIIVVEKHQSHMLKESYFFRLTQTLHVELFSILNLPYKNGFTDGQLTMQIKKND